MQIDKGIRKVERYEEKWGNKFLREIVETASDYTDYDFYRVMRKRAARSAQAGFISGFVAVLFVVLGWFYNGFLVSASVFLAISLSYSTKSWAASCFATFTANRLCAAKETRKYDDEIAALKRKVKELDERVKKLEAKKRVIVVESK